MDKKQVIHDHFAALGRKGAKARFERLTPERRSEIAHIAATARYAKKISTPPTTMLDGKA